MVTINVNDLSLVHRGSGGFAKASLPDVCKTPPGPIPVPYPNVAFSADLAKGTRSVRADGGNSIAVQGSEFATSVGDEPGVAGGVKSGTFKKEATWLSYSPDVLIEGKSACRLTDKMLMNHGNTVCLGGEIQAFLDVLKMAGELAALCEIYCYCRATGGKQACVEQKIYDIDKLSGGLSPMLAEIPYNMSIINGPPRPMMSTTSPRRGSTNWRFPNHPEHPIGFIPNTGMVRRTDVVLIDNPSLPPGGRYLRAVIEMKFPPDSWDTTEMVRREADYLRIAQENNPNAAYLRLDEKICGCDDEGHRAPDYVPVLVPERRWLPVLSPFEVTLPSPSVLSGMGEAAFGLIEMLGGAALFGVSAVGTGVLAADDVTGVGVLDDVAIPVTLAGMGAGGVGMADGYRRWVSGIGKIFGW